MTKLIRFLKPYVFQLILLIAIVYVSVLTSLKLPDYMSKIVNEGIVQKNNDIVFHTGTDMLLVALLGAVCTVAVGYLASRIATGCARTIRAEVFSKVESFSLTEFNKFSTASLITRSTNDIQQIQMVLIMILRIVLQAPIMGVGAIIKAYHMAPSMTWILALAVSVLICVIVLLFAVAMPKFKLLQSLVDKLNLVTRQNLTGLRVIRAFNNEKFEESKFEKTNTELTAANLFVNRLMVIMQPIMTLIFNLTTIAVIWFGAKLIGTEKLMIGDMMAFMQYAMQVIMSFLMISIVFIMIPRASVSAARVAEVLETKLVIKDPKNPERSTKDESGLIEFKDVTFSYPQADQPVLQNINFCAKPGETTALIGSTGSGKSTIINLIPRFYDVTEGEILIDGVNVKNMKLSELYDKIGYVPQKGVLFSGTVKSNIKYGAPKASSKEVEKAANISQSKEFIDNFENKFDTAIAQGGANISGGQKQRLSIARAIIKKPEIYIFDDSFSALDLKTDSLLRKALASEIKNKTVLIVAQRISTILSADKIIVVDEGKIVGMGTHSELLKSCGVYQEIARSQLSEQELLSIEKESAKAPVDLKKNLEIKKGVA